VRWPWPETCDGRRGGKVSKSCSCGDGGLKETRILSVRGSAWQRIPGGVFPFFKSLSSFCLFCLWCFISHRSSRRGWCLTGATCRHHADWKRCTCPRVSSDGEISGSLSSHVQSIVRVACEVHVSEKVEVWVRISKSAFPSIFAAASFFFCQTQSRRMLSILLLQL